MKPHIAQTKAKMRVSIIGELCKKLFQSNFHFKLKLIIASCRIDNQTEMPLYCCAYS